MQENFSKYSFIFFIFDNDYYKFYRDELNVFDGITRNMMFLGILAFIIGL